MSSRRLDNLQISSTFFVRVPIELNEVESAPCREVVFENPAGYLLTRTTSQPPPPPSHELPPEDEKLPFTVLCKKDPAVVVCPRCSVEVTTEVREEMGLTSFLICFVLFVCGCGIGILAYPFLSQFRDRRHNCPSCLKTIHIDKVL